MSGFPCSVRSPCTCMPSPLPRRNRWVHLSLDFPSSGGLPQVAAGSASASLFSRPAQRSLHVTACMLAKSPEVTLYTGVLQPLRYLHDRSDCYRLERLVAGRESHPLKMHAFARHTATRALHWYGQIKVPLCLASGGRPAPVTAFLRGTHLTAV